MNNRRYLEKKRLNVIEIGNICKKNYSKMKKGGVLNFY